MRTRPSRSPNAIANFSTPVRREARDLPPSSRRDPAPKRIRPGIRGETSRRWRSDGHDGITAREAEILDRPVVDTKSDGREVRFAGLGNGDVKLQLHAMTAQGLMSRDLSSRLQIKNPLGYAIR